MENKFDLKELQKRITEVKENDRKLSQFTREFLVCLTSRHDLGNIIYEGQEFEDVPDEIVELIKKGQVPSEDQILMMDEEIQDYLIKECLFICGMGAVAFYSQEEKGDEPNMFDTIMDMSGQSPGHYVGTYLIAAFTLLFCRIPSLEMIQTLTKNFDSSGENLFRCLEFYAELCLSVYNRYLEDKEYYLNE